MSKEIFEVNSHYGEEDFKMLMKKLIKLKLNLQESSIKSLNMDCCTDNAASHLTKHK